MAKSVTTVGYTYEKPFGTFKPPKGSFFNMEPPVSDQSNRILLLREQSPEETLWPECPQSRTA